MLRVEGTQNILGYGPDDVFKAGSLISSLPQMEEMVITPKNKRQKKLKIDSEIDVDFFIPPQIPFVPSELQIPMTVTECRPGEYILIEGDMAIAAASLALSLSEMKGKKQGTTVEHHLVVDCHGLKGKLVEAALHHLLPGKVETFSQLHVAQTTAELEGSRSLAPVSQLTPKTPPSAATAAA